MVEVEHSPQTFANEEKAMSTIVNRNSSSSCSLVTYAVLRN